MTYTCNSSACGKTTTDLAVQQPPVHGLTYTVEKPISLATTTNTYINTYMKIDGTINF